MFFLYFIMMAAANGIAVNAANIGNALDGGSSVVKKMLPPNVTPNIDITAGGSKKIDAEPSEQNAIVVANDGNDDDFSKLAIEHLAQKVGESNNENDLNEAADKEDSNKNAKSSLKSTTAGGGGGGGGAVAAGVPGEMHVEESSFNEKVPHMSDDDFADSTASGFYFFAGISGLALIVIMLKIYRMRLSRAERKYGVQGDRTTQELTPLPVSIEDANSDEDDQTLFEVNRQQIRIL